jgi:transcriptional regulator GlxA family with amidase domain
MATEDFNIILFDGFETLDALGPAEIIGRVPDKAYRLRFYSHAGGLITSTQGVCVDTRPFSEMDVAAPVLIPGGIGVNTLVVDEEFIAALTRIVSVARYVMTVCTGTALLAATGLLDGRSATTNKARFDWVAEQNPRVNWQRRARWVVDGTIYTSSGVTAGMDMALGFIADTRTEELARRVATIIEYVWNDDSHNDPFSPIGVGGSADPTRPAEAD